MNQKDPFLDPKELYISVSDLLELVNGNATKCISKEAPEISQEHLVTTGPYEEDGNLLTTSILGKIVSVKENQAKLSGDANSLPSPNPTLFESIDTNIESEYSESGYGRLEKETDFKRSSTYIEVADSDIGPDNALYHYINNPENETAAEYIKKVATSDELIMLEKLTPEEIARYNYIKIQEGDAQAALYLKTLENDLLKRTEAEHQAVLGGYLQSDTPDIKDVPRIPQTSSSMITKKIESGEYGTSLSINQYNKHKEGTAQYESYLKSRKEKSGNPQSILTISQKEAQQIILQKSGTGIVKVDKNGNPQSREKISCDKVIGKYYGGGKYHDTNKATIHYGKNGAHIVPIKGDDYD